MTLYMVYNATSRGSPRVVHTSYAEASTEARRLSKLHPDNLFLVMQSQTAGFISKVTTEQVDTNQMKGESWV